MTQLASLPTECLPEHTAGTSAYRVSAGVCLQCLLDDTTGKTVASVCLLPSECLPDDTSGKIA